MTTKQKGIILPHLRSWREWHALKQEELAAKAGVTETTISRLENGSPARIGTIDKLATALGITRVQLIRSQPEEKSRAA